MMLSEQTGNKEKIAQLFLIRLLVLLIIAGQPRFCLIARASGLLGLTISEAISTEIEIAVSLSG